MIYLLDDDLDVIALAEKTALCVLNYNFRAVSDGSVELCLEEDDTFLPDVSYLYFSDERKIFLAERYEIICDAKRGKRAVIYLKGAEYLLYNRYFAQNEYFCGNIEEGIYSLAERYFASDGIYSLSTSRVLPPDTQGCFISSNERISDRLYSALAVVGASYVVDFDFPERKFIFRIVASDNSKVVFSSGYGNIARLEYKSANITYDSVNIRCADGNFMFGNGAPLQRRELTLALPTLERGELTEEEYSAALESRARELLFRENAAHISFAPTEDAASRFGEAFVLGDVLSLDGYGDAVIVEAKKIYKDGKSSLELVGEIVRG